MWKGLILVLVLLPFYCAYSIASDNRETLHDIEDEDFEINEDFSQIQICDPYEKFNRSIYKFNKTVNKFIINPPAQIYGTIAPGLIKKRVSSFFSNLQDPLTAIYGILQLNLKVAFDSFFRFFINSTFGVLGMFDVAEEAGLKKRNLYFADVLRYYGAKEGPYLMLPLLGPSTVRGGVGTIIDTVADPVNVVTLKNHRKFRNYYYIGKVIVTREQMADKDKTLSEISLDEYATMRNFYYQKLARLSRESN